MFSGSLVAIVTPMHPDGSIDWPAWERLLAFQLAAGTSGVVVGGTTGESATLSDEDLLGLLERARARLRGRAALIAGAGTSSTAHTVARARLLSGAGVDALLVVTPAYNKPTQEGLYRHFEAVAAASSVPVVLYNVPSRTAVDMLPSTVARLAKLPRIVAVKEAVASVERVRELLALVPESFRVLSGDDASALAAMTHGARCRRLWQSSQPQRSREIARRHCAATSHCVRCTRLCSWRPTRFQSNGPWRSADSFRLDCACH
jgi:4-hydroxy-tetrahydrodipicolinate synthase